MKLFLLIALAVASLVLPATAPAAEVVGSDFTQAGAAVPLACAEPCTIVADEIGGAPLRVSGPAVVTSFKTLLGSGTAGRLRIVRRGGGGTFTDVASSGLVFGDGQIQTHTMSVPFGAGEHTIAIDLLGGEIAAVPARGAAWAITPALVPGATATGAMRDGEVMLSVRVEADRDADGLGDETEDPRVDTGAGTGGGGGGSLPDPPANGGGGDAPPAPTPPATGGGDGGANRPVFALDSRAILRSGAAGAAGYVSVFGSWQGLGTLEGTLELRLGKRLLGRNTLEVDGGDEPSWGNYRLRPDERRRLLRAGRLRLESVARLRYPDGRRVTARRPMTLLAGGPTTAYDGIYTGPGPVRIEVERGVLVSISTTLNLFCSRSKRHMTRGFYGLGVFPALIGRDGSFNVKGSARTDTMRYYGKLRRSGTSKGYLSMFHTLFGLDASGRVSSEQCFDARNWKVTRAR